VPAAGAAGLAAASGSGGAGAAGRENTGGAGSAAGASGTAGAANSAGTTNSAGAAASGSVGVRVPMIVANVAPFAPGNYELVFADEFDGDALDRSQWCTRLAWPGGVALESELESRDPACTGPTGDAGTQDFLKKEQQRYVIKNARGEDTHVVSGGTLKLRATKTRDDSYAAYESGLIRSKLSFVPAGNLKYYITGRVRIPNVQGTFAAMWLVNGFGKDTASLNWPPEIDIFEAALNVQDDKANMLRIGAHVSVNGPQTATGAVDFKQYTKEFDPRFNNYNGPQSVREVWMVFSAEWTADHICYYVNDANVMCENYHWVTPTGAAANPAQLIINLAIGDEWAGRYGIDDSKFPTALEVDYVRIYSQR
jgi:beta-glucanase (GH16 family)